MVVGHALEKTLHCDRGNEPRHLAAEAEVLAGAKAEVTLRATLDIIDIRVGKFPPIAVAGAECKRHFVAEMHFLAVQLGLAHDRALETLRRSVKAQRLLDRRFDQCGIRDDATACIGMIVQVEREHAHEARERFHSRHDEGRRREHDLALANRSPSISASARWVMRSSVGFARRTATSAVRKSLSSLKAAICSGLRPFADLSVETARMTLRLMSA